MVLNAKKQSSDGMPAYLEILNFKNKKGSKLKKNVFGTVCNSKNFIFGTALPQGLIFLDG